MVRVWAADITPLLIEETYQAYYDKVPEWRKDKADKLKNVFFKNERIYRIKVLTIKSHCVNISLVLRFK